MNKPLHEQAEDQLKNLVGLTKEERALIPSEDMKFLNYLEQLSENGGLLMHEQLFRLELLHKKYCG